MESHKCVNCGAVIADRSKAVETRDGLLCQSCAGRSDSSEKKSSK